MNRNLQTDGIILQTRRIGDIHKVLKCLTPDYGIIDVMAYGAGKGKSKLAGMVDPFSLLYFYLYFDPVKDSYKVSDIEQKEIFPGIRGDLEKFYIASFWAEVILKSFSGGGESKTIFPLLYKCLNNLNASGKSGLSMITIQFIWHYIGIAGFRPDTEFCGNCEKLLNESEQVCFEASSNQFLCTECGRINNTPVISMGGVKFLRNTRELDLDKSLKISLDLRSADNLKRIMIAIIQGIVEYPLNTLKKGLI